MGIIVVPLDGSEFAERALGLARTLGEALRDGLTLAQVIPEPALLDFPGDVSAQAERAAERYLRDVALRLSPTPVERVVLRGEPADELLAFVGRHAGALLVMSTHGRGGLGRAVFGSVADKVARAAAAPVVLVPAVASDAPARIGEVLVPLDGSALAEAALAPALELARATGAALRLVRVVPPIWESYFTYGPMSAYLTDAQATQLQRQADAEARAYVDTVAARLDAGSGGVTALTRRGRAADVLLRLAGERPDGMLVMATHGRGGLRRWALGSVTTEIAQRSPLPVMVVPNVTAPTSNGG